MRSLMRVSSVEIAASPLVVVPPTRKRRRTRRKRPPPPRQSRFGCNGPDSGSPAGWGIPADAGNPTSPQLSTCQDTSVSSLWTPSGEHQPQGGPPPGPGGDGGPPPDPSRPPGDDP